MTISAPCVDEVRRLQQRLQEWLHITPVLRCRALEERVGGSIEIHGKMEFLQRTGTFKPRGALATMLSLGKEQLEHGVAAVSAGNHAIATAFAARAVGTTAKVVMIRTASPVRVEAAPGIPERPKGEKGQRRRAKHNQRVGVSVTQEPSRGEDLYGYPLYLL